MFKSLLLLLGAAACLTYPVSAATISDNLANPVQSTEFVGGDTWIAAQFGVTSQASTLSSITLLMDSLTPGATARLDLYSSNSSGPATPLGTLASPTAYATSLAPTVFGGNAIALQPNALYWAVLRATSGEFEWGWTASTTGLGTGFRAAWAASDDAGLTWFPSPRDPMLMSVAVTDSSAIPEPGTLALVTLFALVTLPLGVQRITTIFRNSTVF